MCKSPVIVPPKEIQTVADLCQMFWYLEEKYNLLDWAINGVKVWQYIRMRLYYDIAQKTGVFEFPSAVRDDEEPLWSLRRQFKQIANTLLYHPFRGGPVENLVFCTGRYEAVDDDYVNIYLKGLMADLMRHHERYLKLDFPYLGQYMPKVKPNSRRMDALFLRKDQSFVLKKLGYRLHSLCKKYAFPGRKKLKIWLNHQLPKLSTAETERQHAINAEIEAICGISFSLDKYLKRKCFDFQVEYNFYHKLLAKKRPRRIYLVCSYGKAPLIWAAKQLGIEVVEIQHGTFSPYHLGYSFPGRKNDLDYFPTHFYSWGRYWTSILDFPLSDDRISHQGFAHFRQQQKLTSQGERNSRQIAVMSQGAISGKLAEALLAHIDALAGYDIVYKLHPSELNTYHLSDNLMKLATYPNVTLAKTDVDLYALFTQSNYVLGVFSTAIYEGIALGCKPILVDLPGLEYMDGLIRTYKIPVLRPDSDLQHLMQAAQSCEIPCHDIF